MTRAGIVGATYGRTGDRIHAPVRRLESKRDDDRGARDDDGDDTVSTEATV